MKVNNPRFHCFHLDAGDAFSCHWEGPYKFTRGLPSKAFVANSEGPGAQFLVCIPGLNLYTNEARKPGDTLYNELVREQSSCTQFKESHK
ncbi:hypothetical protein A3D00_04040 [Candidatus Woesebacteria bacterium RIFCSPHIGHO2_02_FULL_38_9]|uniref:Uncharacterized protein n=1 Tax=Candidatus Woesebacteria bacterium RIFCSPHIGHO2_01_FULL_39_28 TaxID=1802496 RepID=A0A1F7YJ33_9BACT|nr:MAG: hypothetical protein A2627_03395 [Candidatus Woesebacteria bacterium RIFCSPHIGHO2_01_FULL_39_28]OGM34094.1 MAG: hypothetical protein A3D00_04040 [Candidatus Woesebacteria bacterium RIFCSPHIGHO2_02_FULL_38_9]OGM56976.1 MAG: hypothetical protein A3A50_03740 [Candidatus Woesebacteria bacterium RIFCSPLOWO2_01_FULL_38_20]